MYTQPYVNTYRVVGNFREAEIFTIIFVIKRQLAKICSCENFFKNFLLMSWGEDAEHSVFEPQIQ